MSLHSVRYFKSRLFIDGHNCKFNKNNVCRCSTPGCPYRVEVATLGSTHGKKRVASVVRVIFPHHWNGGPQEHMKERRKLVVQEKALIERKGEGWEALKAQHDAMRRQVERESAERMSHLQEKLAVETYAVQHPHLSGSAIKDCAQTTCTPEAIFSFSAFLLSPQSASFCFHFFCH